MHGNSGERRSDPIRNWARLACVCLRVPGGGGGEQWPAHSQGYWQHQSWEAWHAGISPFEGGCHYHHYPYHSLASVKLQGGNTALPINRKLDLRLTDHALAHHNKTQFSPPPVGKPEKASYPHASEGRQNENHYHRKLTKLITWTTTLPNSMKLWAMKCQATQERWVMVKSLDKDGPLEKGMGKTTSAFLPWEPHEQYEKETRYDAERWTLQISGYPTFYWRRAEK